MSNNTNTISQVKDAVPPEYTATRFFKKYAGQGKSLAWLAEELGYSPVYVRKVSCGMIGLTYSFIGRAVLKLGEDTAIFKSDDNTTTGDQGN